jgi:hypothetical protein
VLQLHYDSDRVTNDKFRCSWIGLAEDDFLTLVLGCGMFFVTQRQYLQSPTCNKTVMHVHYINWGFPTSFYFYRCHRTFLSTAQTYDCDRRRRT